MGGEEGSGGEEGGRGTDVHEMKQSAMSDISLYICSTWKGV